MSEPANFDGAILAKHNGRCPLCRSKIVKGESLIVHFEGDHVHEECRDRELERRRDKWITVERYEATHDTALAELLLDTGLLYRINHLVLHEVGLDLVLTTEDDCPVGFALRRANEPDDLFYGAEAIEQGRRQLREANLSDVVRGRSSTANDEPEAEAA